MSDVCLKIQSHILAFPITTVMTGNIQMYGVNCPVEFHVLPIKGISTSKYIHTHSHTHTHTYTYIHTYIRSYVHTYIHVYMHTYMRIYIHGFISTKYLYVCVCIYIYIYDSCYLNRYIYRKISFVL